MTEQILNIRDLLLFPVSHARYHGWFIRYQERFVAFNKVRISDDGGFADH